MSPDIRVGTSGWNYPAGRGTWNGIFYPSRRTRGFDELAYYADHFDTVEVNSTFYRMPDPALCASWVRRTPADFLFAVKLYQKFTHPDMFLARDGVADWTLSAGDFDEFRRGVDPIAGAGRLAAILVQFPPSFHAEPETRAYLDWLLEALSGYPRAVELRHRSWSDDSAETRRQLDAQGAAWVLIDEPKFESSIRQAAPSAPTALSALPAPSAPPAFSYFRFHGRNAAAWWEHDQAEDRYNYMYSRAELAPFAQAARGASASGGRVLMYMNNHFSAKAVASAAILKNELGQALPGEYPQEIVSQYPELSGLVATSGLPL